jgi:ABC-type Na+ transport system ATPase subunit NatA
MTFDEQMQDLTASQEAYFERLKDLSHMTGAARAREIRSLKAFAEKTNERLDEFSQSIGQGINPIDTESLLMIEMTRVAEEEP